MHACCKGEVVGAAYLLAAAICKGKQALIHNVEITTTQEIITCNFFFHFLKYYWEKGKLLQLVTQIAAICSNQDIL